MDSADLRVSRSGRALCCALMCALSCLGLTAAQASPGGCTSTGTHTLNGAALSTFSACAVFTGDIYVRPVLSATEVSQQPPSSTVTLPASLKTIVGSVEFSDIESEDSAIGYTIVSYDLKSVSKDLRFVDLQGLITVDLGQLQEVGQLIFENVAFQSAVPFNGLYAGRYEGDEGGQVTSLQSFEAMTFSNTTVTSIGPFLNLATNASNLSGTVSITAVNNLDLTTISLSGLSNRDVNITVNDNSMAGLSLDLNDVSKASLQLSGVSSLDAPLLQELLPALGSNTSMTISQNSFTNLSLPNLTKVDGTLQIHDNADLTSVSFPNLRTVESLEIYYNRALGYVDLSNLAAANKSLVIDASLTSLNLSRFRDYNKNVKIDATGTWQCSSLPPRGQKRCSTTPVAHPFPSSSGSSSPSQHSAYPVHWSRSGLSPGAKVGIGVGIGIGGALILAGAVLFCLRWRRRKAARNPRSAVADEYAMGDTKSRGTSDRSPVRYSKVPVTGTVNEAPRHPSPEGQRPISSLMGDSWTPPEPEKEGAEGRVELEEQQGPRHEMDARSLPDMERDDEEDEETRSLQDIERAHGHT